jgi:hypothetical protein
MLALGGKMSRTYPSRIDAHIFFFVVVVPLGLLFATITGLPIQLYRTSIILRTLFVVVLLFALWTALGTSYTLDAGSLRIRCGPFRWTIALREIRSATPTRDARSGPALSLDRLRIEYGTRRRILISPRDQETFLRDLEHRRSQCSELSAL